MSVVPSGMTHVPLPDGVSVSVTTTLPDDPISPSWIWDDVPVMPEVEMEPLITFVLVLMVTEPVPLAEVVTAVASWLPFRTAAKVCVPLEDVVLSVPH